MEYIIALSIVCILISAITGYMYQEGMNKLFENYREIIEMMRKLNDEHTRQ